MCPDSVVLPRLPRVCHVLATGTPQLAFSPQLCSRSMLRSRVLPPYGHPWRLEKLASLHLFTREWDFLYGHSDDDVVGRGRLCSDSAVCSRRRASRTLPFGLIPVALGRSELVGGCTRLRAPETVPRDSCMFIAALTSRPYQVQGHVGSAFLSDLGCFEGIEH